MRRRHRAGAGWRWTAVLLVAGCASGDDEPSATESTTTTEGTATSSAGGDAPAGDQGGAAAAASAEADTGSGEPIVAGRLDGGPGLRRRHRRVRGPQPATDRARPPTTECPGGSPVNAQRLAADLTAYLVPSQTEDPNVVIDDQPLPIPYVSQLPEIVLVGVGEQRRGRRWFVGISPVSRLLLSVPNTYLRPAPSGARDHVRHRRMGTDRPGRAVESTEMVALRSAFVPADFDPADYQFRIGRGDDYAYCWPLEDLGTPAELGRCR